MLNGSEQFTAAEIFYMCTTFGMFCMWLWAEFVIKSIRKDVAEAKRTIDEQNEILVLLQDIFKHHQALQIMTIKVVHRKDSLSKNIIVVELERPEGIPPKVIEYKDIGSMAMMTFIAMLENTFKKPIPADKETTLSFIREKVADRTLIRNYVYYREIEE